MVEPGLDDLLAANRERISFCAEPKSLAACDIVYVAPDIPTDDQGHSDLASVDALLSSRARGDPGGHVSRRAQPGSTRLYARAAAA